jgi:NADPH-dependent 2,4-dienoyl-CoA reductase/sulfur reductase-like enzyme/rhodanese-related sulfurtransferase
MSDFVIIGGVAAGPKTAATLARRLPGANITLYQKEDVLSYATCGFPFFASGEVNAFDALLKTSYGVVRDAGFFRDTKGVNAVTSAEVTAIDRANKKVTVKMLGTGKELEHGYGRLIIATGSTPKKPPFPVPESDKVRPFTRPADAVGFRQSAQRGEIEKVVIVGGGFIGIELCEAVKDMWGIEVTLFEEQPQLLTYMLDSDMAGILRRSLENEGIEVETNSRVEKVELDENGSPVVFAEGREPSTVDYVFLCLGVNPEVALARECGIVLGETGGIRVNEFLQTSDENIYAGGDCIETVHRLTGRRFCMPMGSLANRHGRVIAENLAGNKTSFPGVVGAFVLRASETNAGGVGLSEESAANEGLSVRSVWGAFTDKPDYNPEVKTIALKMVYEENSTRLLGLQAVGKGDICRRIDVFSSLLQSGARVEDVFDFEHGYAPPFAEALDPLHHMAGIAASGKRGANFVGPGEFPVSIDKDTLVLDVREAEETENTPLPSAVIDSAGGVIHIPLNELRNRAGELDRDRRIFIICQRGTRSYQASLILRAAGFEKVDILAAGLQAQG